MKKVFFVLLFAPTAHATSGSAICFSEQSANYNVQFSWDDEGRLTSAALFKSSGRVDERLYDFQIERDTHACAIGAKSAKVALRSPSGESVVIDAKIDDHGVGQGTLAWKIPSEHFEESDAPLTCSF